MTDRLAHYVNREAFNPYSIETLTAEQERYYMAPQWKIIWWRFREHRVAVVSLIILLIAYASILISEVLAPYELH